MEGSLGKVLRLAADPQDQRPPTGRLQEMVEAMEAQKQQHASRLASNPAFTQPGDVEQAIAALVRDLVRYGLDEKTARTYAEQLISKARSAAVEKVTPPPKAGAKKKPAKKKASSGKLQV